MALWQKIEKFVRDQRKWILFFTALIISVILFLLIAEQIYANRNLPSDEPILLFIHTFTSPFLSVFFTTITHLGDSIVVLIIAAILVLYYAYRKMYQRLFLVISGIGGVVTSNTVLKSIFQRDRPSFWRHIVEETNFSFPSGHATLSAALAALLIILSWNTKYRWLVMVLALAGVFLVGISRVYLGVHYPSDILAGWCVSIAWVLLISAVGIYLFRDGRQPKADSITKG